MKRALVILVFAMTLGVPTLTTKCHADPFGPEAPIVLPPISVDQLRSFEEQMHRLLPKVKPSCVRIQSWGGVPVGSGFIFDSTGLILTHGHGGVKPGDRVKLTLGNAARTHLVVRI